jgi:hypothetical protein
MIRIEFWNGQTSNKAKYRPYGGLVTTNHNPCLWSNTLDPDKPWRHSWPKACEYIDRWRRHELNATELLHGLRHVAYGYNSDGPDKRSYDDVEVVWPGNLTHNHRPKLTYMNELVGDHMTLYFQFINDEWTITVEPTVEWYWPL